MPCGNKDDYSDAPYQYYKSETEKLKSMICAVFSELQNKNSEDKFEELVSNIEKNSGVTGIMEEFKRHKREDDLNRLKVEINNINDFFVRFSNHEIKFIIEEGLKNRGIKVNIHKDI